MNLPGVCACASEVLFGLHPGMATCSHMFPLALKPSIKKKAFLAYSSSFSDFERLGQRSDKTQSHHISSLRTALSNKILVRPPKMPDAALEVRNIESSSAPGSQTQAFQKERSTCPVRCSFLDSHYLSRPLTCYGCQPCDDPCIRAQMLMLSLQLTLKCQPLIPSKQLSCFQSCGPEINVPMGRSGIRACAG